MKRPPDARALCGILCAATGACSVAPPYQHPAIPPPAVWRETPAQDSRGRGFSARLVSIDITGFNERSVTTPTDASEPAWSPLLS